MFQSTKNAVLIPAIFLVLVILLPHWRLTTMQGVMITDDIFTSDLMNDGFPYRFHLGEALKQGEFPLWYPPVYGGFPLVARAESGVCFPPAILLFGLLPPYVALNLLILFTLVTAAIGMFLFARQVTGSVTGALLAGTSFAWSGFMVSHIKHLSMIGTASLFPFALLALERSARADRGSAGGPLNLMAFSAIFGLQILAGHIQVAYYAGIVYVLFVLLRPAQVRPVPGKGSRGRGRSVRWRKVIDYLKIRNAGAFVCALALAGGIGAVQLAPTYELVQQSSRAEGVSFSYAASYAYDPANIVTFAVPYANGDISDGSYRGRSVFWEDYGYSGVVVLLLALIAVFTQWRTWYVKFFALAALGAYLVVLGPNTPIYRAVFHLLPGMQFFRFPTRFLFMVNTSLAVLAAFGAGQVVATMIRRTPSRLHHTVPVVLVALVATDLIFHQLRQNPVVSLERWKEPPKTAALLKEDPGLFRIYTPGSSDVHKQAFALAKGWSGDLSWYLRQREFLQPSSNVLYGISSADGYAQLTPAYVVDLWGDQNGPGLIYNTASVQGGLFRPSATFMKIMNMANVKYLLSAWPVEGPFTVPVDTVEGVFVFRNPSVLPRAYLVAGYRVARSPATAKALLLSEGFQPAEEAILYADPALTAAPPGGPSKAAVISYRNNEVVIATSAAADRLLVLSDTDYPGWKAEVDGKETRIYRANLSQRAVVVPAGDHTVRFLFEAPTVRWGLVLTLLSTCGLIAGGLVARKRGDRSQLAGDSR